MKSSNKALFLTYSAIIAAAYVVLTLVSASFGLGYGQIQFRLSEALTVLPIFTPAAIPGLAVGCIIANIFSFNPIDMIVGTSATLIAAVLTRKTRNITIKGLPLLSLLWPVLFNAVFVGGELSLLYSTAKATLAVFTVYALQVGAGQLIVCYGIGLPLYFALRKKDVFKKI